MLIVALTGGIGSGKSLVAQYFSNLGARVIDADQLSRQVIERGTEGFDKVIATFGDSILRDGEIDRRALAAIVFADIDAKVKLESIIHPRVREAFDSAKKLLGSDDILIYEIPLLVEAGLAQTFDYVITVESNLNSRKERLLGRGMHTSEIAARMLSQASPEARIAIADHVITNDGSPDELLREVEEAWEKIRLISKRAKV